MRSFLGGFVCVGMLQAAVSAGQPLPTLHVHPVDIGKDGSGVVFAVPDGVTVAGTPERQLGDSTSQGLFAFEVDLTELRWVEDCRCLRHYVFYVRPRGSQSITRFKVKAKPTGRFPDHWEAVAFDVALGASKDTGSVRLPVEAEQSDSDELVQQNRDVVQAIDLRGERHLRFELRNSLPDTVLSVKLPPTVRSDDETVLSVWSMGAHPPTLKIEPGKSRQVEVIVRPSPLAAVRRSLRPSPPTTSHARVEAEFTYNNPVLPGRDGSLTAVAEVRFVPDRFVLFLVLMLGVLLGSGVAFLVPQLTPRRMGKARALAIVLAAGTALELLAMLLAANNSRLVLFGFDLDPWQTLPAAVVGIVVGVLGMRGVELLPFVRSEAGS